MNTKSFPQYRDPATKLPTDINFEPLQGPEDKIEDLSVKPNCVSEKRMLFTCCLQHVIVYIIQLEESIYTLESQTERKTREKMHVDKVRLLQEDTTKIERFENDI